MNNKKFMSTLIGVFTLIILLFSATYAFYTVSNNINYSNNTVVTGRVGLREVVTLDNLTNDLHIILNNDDMSLNNPKVYYAATGDDKYILEEKNRLHKIASLTTDSTDNFSCMADVIVTLTVTSGSMGNVLESGDIILHLEGGNLNQDLDLSTIKIKGTQKYSNVEFNVSGNKETTLDAYMKLTNKVTNTDYLGSQQNYLAGKRLDVTVEVNNLRCEAKKS